MVIFKRFVWFQYVKIYVGLFEATWFNMDAVYSFIYLL